jgi:hypothetical protein
MPKLPSLLFLLATLVAPSSRNPGNPAAEAFRKVASGHSKAMLAAAMLMPAEKYGYRPTPAQRSLGETIAREGEFPACHDLSSLPGCCASRLSHDA